jgi:hypothetical protein
MVDHVMNQLGSKPTAHMFGPFGSTPTQVTAKFMEFLGDLDRVIAQLMSLFVDQAVTAEEII